MPKPMDGWAFNFIIYTDVARENKIVGPMKELNKKLMELKKD